MPTNVCVKQGERHMDMFKGILAAALCAVTAVCLVVVVITVGMYAWDASENVGQFAGSMALAIPLIALLMILPIGAVENHRVPIVSNACLIAWLPIAGLLAVVIGQSSVGLPALSIAGMIASGFVTPFGPLAIFVMLYYSEVLAADVADRRAVRAQAPQQPTQPVPQNSAPVAQPEPHQPPEAAVEGFRAWAADRIEQPDTSENASLDVHDAFRDYQAFCLSRGLQTLSPVEFPGKFEDCMVRNGLPYQNGVVTGIRLAPLDNDGLTAS